MASPLGTDAILCGMADALPTHPKDDESSDLASSYEAIGLLIHAYMTALGFKLVGFDEEKKMPECESLSPRLPQSWNARYGTLSFVYTHKQSAMTFVVRVDRMGSKVEVRGLAVGDEKIYRFERAVRDVVRSAGLPVKIDINADGEEDRGGLVEKMRGAFVSESAIADILNDLKTNIIQKLIPKLQREGYVESETAEAQTNATNERRAQEGRNPEGAPFSPANNFNPPPQPNPLPEMARPRPRAPVPDFPPPGFEDEHQMNRPPPGFQGGGFMPGRSPFNIGHDDLNPPGLGPHDPLRGSFVGGGIPRPGGVGGGMHPTFDDPLFVGPGGGSYPGQGGYDPQAPPGARWDPFGPGGPRFPGQGGGRGGNPFGGFGGGDYI